MGSLTVNTVIRQSIRWLTRQLQKRMPYDPHNPYLEGPYAPVESEFSTSQLNVSGEIPAELNGLLLRIGPNPLQMPANPAAYHWFMGDGMVHGLRLRHGRALWYRRRYVGQDNIHQALGRPLAPGPRRGAADVVNTNIIGHAGTLWALVEAGAYPVELDHELETRRHGLFNSHADMGFSAHPHVDPDTGELHAICYDGLHRNQVRYVSIDRDGTLKRIVSIPLLNAPMIHDCALTESRILILDLPVTFSLRSALRGAGLPYAWNPRRQARIGLLPRAGNAEDISWYHVEPCFVFHTCNAFDLSNGDVIVDLVVHDRVFTESLQGPLERQPIRFERWRLEHSTGKVHRHVVSALAQEFPRFDERRTGKPYRYAYTIGATNDLRQLTPNRLYRHDLETGTTQEHSYGPDNITGEVVFVPRREESAEDDGWLLSFVHGLKGGPSQVVILDSRRLGGAAQAVIELPVRVPLGFHGNWVAMADG